MVLSNANVTQLPRCPRARVLFSLVFVVRHVARIALLEFLRLSFCAPRIEFARRVQFFPALCEIQREMARYQLGELKREREKKEQKKESRERAKRSLILMYSLRQSLPVSRCESFVVARVRNNRKRRAPGEINEVCVTVSAGRPVLYR